MLTSERQPDPDDTRRRQERKLWLRATGALILIVGTAFAIMLCLGIGGMAPAWGLLLYMPFVFIGMAALKFAAQGFRVRRKSLR